MESACCLLEDLQIKQEFWGYAVLTAGHIHNRLPSQSDNNTSVIKFWTGKPPSIGHLWVFGSTVWVHILKETGRKLDSVLIKGILVGYEEEASWKVYLVYDTQAKQALVSRDVISNKSSGSGEHKTANYTARKTRIEWEPNPRYLQKTPRLAPIH